MPKTLDEIIEENLRVLTDAEDDDALQTAREIICPFYGKGGNPDCKGCAKADDTVDECKGSYISRIKHRPMEVWSAEFDKIEVREKKSFDFETTLALRCDKCNISDVCPEFKARATCSIEWSSTDDTTNSSKMLDHLITLQDRRINFASAGEKMDGGTPDQTLSNEMDRMSAMLAARADLNADKFKLTIEGSATGKGGGILAKLFSPNGNNIEGGAPVNTIEENKQKTLDADTTEYIEIKPTDKPEEIELPAKKRPSKKATIKK